jgi:putative ABC transport system ATP-binding protein
MSNPQYIIEARNVGCLYDTKLEGSLQTDSMGAERKNFNHGSGIFVEHLKIPSTGITTIIGPSGSGKSTLIGLLSGLREENANKEGQYLNFESMGTSYSLLNPQNVKRGDFGYVFQEAQLLKNIPARLNAEMAAQATATKQYQSKVDFLAEDLEIGELLDNKTATLSGGQAQRLACIRALAISPNVLVCDEPTSSLDTSTSKHLLKVIETWAKKENKAVLWVTHDLGLAADFSDYLINVDKGKVVCNPDGTPFDLTQCSRSEALEIIEEFKIAPTETASPLKIKKYGEKVYKKNIIEETYISFCFRMALFEVYGSKKKNASGSYSGIKIRQFYQAYGRSMTWAMCLGVVVLFSLLSIWQGTTSYFKEELDNPEVSHVIFSTQGTYKLNTKNIREVQRVLASRANLDSEETFIFGRREFNIKDIWLPGVEGCSERTEQSDAVPLMIYNEDEPLFQRTFGPLVTDLKEPLKPYVVGTDLLKSSLAKHLSEKGLSEKNSPDKLSICVDIKGVGVEFDVLDYQGYIPGGSDRTFFIAMPEHFYRDALIEVAPHLYKASTFHFAATYFTQDSIKHILCAFEPLKNCNKPPILDPEIFKLNKDVVKQVDRLSASSRVAKIILTVLILSFIIVICMSTTLALSAFVNSNEKTLALLKAFRAGTVNLLVIINAHTLVIFCNAIILSGMICAIISWSVHEYSTQIYLTENIDFGLKFMDFVVASGFILILVVLCGSGVIINWNRKQKYVGPTLQSM